jgi:hypothetical protein
MNDFVTKPYNPDALFVTLLQWLQHVVVNNAQGIAGQVKIQHSLRPEIPSADRHGQ